MSKRGPRSLRRARRGMMGLTEVVRHRRGGGAAAARRVSDDDDAFRRPMVMRTVPEDQREKEHDESGPFWLGEGEQRSSPWSKEGGGLSTGGAQDRPLHGEAPEYSISSVRWGSGSAGAQGRCGSAIGSLAGRVARKGQAWAMLGC
jgi:hypothetical protein